MHLSAEALSRAMCRTVTRLLTPSAFRSKARRNRLAQSAIAAAASVPSQFGLAFADQCVRARGAPNRSGLLRAHGNSGCPCVRDCDGRVHRPRPAFRSSAKFGTEGGRAVAHFDRQSA